MGDMPIRLDQDAKLFSASHESRVFDHIADNYCVMYCDDVLIHTETDDPAEHMTRLCTRCLLITESPKTPGHYRYLKLGPRLHPLYGIGVVQFCDLSCSCVYCGFESSDSYSPRLKVGVASNLLISVYFGGVKAHCYG